METAKSNEPAGHVSSWFFTSLDLQIAKRSLSLIVGDDPSRAVSLEPVLRWRTDEWNAFSGALHVAGFDRRNPGHLAAMQWSIDQAGDTVLPTASGDVHVHREKDR